MFGLEAQSRTDGSKEGRELFERNAFLSFQLFQCEAAIQNEASNNMAINSAMYPRTKPIREP